MSINANRWLAVRLEFIGSFIILAAAGFAIVAVSTGGGPSAGMVGLAMSYALQVTQSLNWIVRQTVEVETYVTTIDTSVPTLTCVSNLDTGTLSAWNGP